MTTIYADTSLMLGIAVTQTSDYVWDVRTTAGLINMTMATEDEVVAGNQVYVVKLPGSQYVAIPTVVLTGVGIVFGCSTK